MDKKIDRLPPGTVIGRDAAARQGLSRYRTGKPCSRGHVAERLVASYTCVECHREAKHRAELLS